MQATRTFGASAGDVAALTAVLLASQTLSTLFWGCRRRPDRADARAARLGRAVRRRPGVALLAPDLLWFALVFRPGGAVRRGLAVTDAGMPLALAEGAGARS